VLLAVTSLELTACTAQPAPDSGFNGWYDRMQTVFHDANGMGGGGGPTPGSVQLGPMRTGSWVVYAACDRSDAIHLRIRGAGRLLAESDVPCGATVAVPIAVDRAAARRFEIETNYPRGSSGPDWWSAQINSTSWRQDDTFHFG
jgi:hypothetical protein